MLLKQKYIKMVFWALAFTVLVLSSMPGSGAINYSIKNLDKSAHFGAFFLLSILLLFAYKFSKPFFTTALLMALFGFAIELLHIYVPQRVFSLYDFAADLLGIIVALIIYRMVRNKFIATS